MAFIIRDYGLEIFFGLRLCGSGGCQKKKPGTRPGFNRIEIGDYLETTNWVLTMDAPSSTMLSI